MLGISGPPAMETFVFAFLGRWRGVPGRDCEDGPRPAIATNPTSADIPFPIPTPKVPVRLVLPWSLAIGTRTARGPAWRSLLILQGRALPRPGVLPRLRGSLPLGLARQPLRLAARLALAARPRV